VIEEVNYQGYDALLPWREALHERYFPYTPYWHALAALEAAARRLLDEGLERVFERHTRAAAACRQGLRRIGLEPYPRDAACASPTVTAVKVPPRLSWPALDGALRRRGVVVGGNYGPLAGKVFRLGHMGTQADERLVDQAVEALAEALRG
jgi:aspartate aminotransferase-like enzyme